ncbi:Chitinase-like protein [Arachis hypogaea]|nr:Chitinase-like protein [Arachis hypogaea]
MAINFKTLSLAIFTILVLNAEAAVKGGYWYYDSGLVPSAIDSSYFTHLFCAFAKLNPNTNKITLPSSTFSTFTQTVQKKNPSVKTLLSIGGGGEGSAPFPTMANSSASRKIFIDSSIQVARSNNFHGLDLDWEYPTAVAGSDQISPLKYYNGEAISKNLDWVNVMVYDLFIPSGFKTTMRPPAPLYNPGGQFSGDQGITAWMNQVGVGAKKLAIGLPFYGYAWKLVNANNHGLFAAANGGGSTPSGDGTPLYSDIRSFIKNQGAKSVYNSTYVTNYCYSGTTWVGYDDTQSVFAKVNYAKGRGLLGYFAWQIGGDDSWTLSKADNLFGTVQLLMLGDLKDEGQGSVLRVIQ